MSAGFLRKMTIYPLVYTVQLTSLLYVKFETEHHLYEGARVIITPPPGLILPADGTEIEVTPIAGSTRATKATITGGTIVIDNFVQVAVNEAPYYYQFALSNIAN